MTPSADWTAGVPCKEAPELFFSYSLGDQERAAGICRTECPALSECKAWALHHGDIDHKGRAVHGVIAGVLPPPRRTPGPSMRPCNLCGRLFVGERHRRYCSDECVRTARAAQKQADRERRRWAS